MSSTISKGIKAEYKTSEGTLVAQVEKHDHVYILHMVNGDNRLRPDTISTLIKALDDIEKDFKTDRAKFNKEGKDAHYSSLVTTGNAHYYSNGLDFALIMSGKVSTIEFFEKFYHKLLLRFLNMPFPTVAAINGHAFAGGMMLAFVHDYKVMRDDRGFLCMPEVDLPGALSPGMMAVVKEGVPNSRDAQNVMLQGIRIDGKTALEKGMVDAIGSSDEVLHKAKELALKWAHKSAKSPTIYKQLRLELRADTVKALESGGIGFIPKL
ncbi:hypothetical protein DSO57_1037536 [Entomophthora muscae]|uniref:Uncharacterized protein n=1 Tax=Entomophthora muscae TaxID=34485 RepID=A0ACC2TX54_9FUNG|nr:hypothetical protein DSO57_1037536 [Entomophthora muscae]